MPLSPSDIKKIAKEVVRLLPQKEDDDMLFLKDLKKMFGVNTNQAIYDKMSPEIGLPYHRKKGIGLYFFKSEILEFLKRD